MTTWPVGDLAERFQFSTIEGKQATRPRPVDMTWDEVVAWVLERQGHAVTAKGKKAATVEASDWAILAGGPGRKYEEMDYRSLVFLDVDGTDVVIDDKWHQDFQSKYEGSYIFQARRLSGSNTQQHYHFIFPLTAPITVTGGPRGPERVAEWQYHARLMAAWHGLVDVDLKVGTDHSMRRVSQPFFFYTKTKGGVPNVDPTRTVVVSNGKALDLTAALANLPVRVRRGRTVIRTIPLETQDRYLAALDRGGYLLRDVGGVATGPEGMATAVTEGKYYVTCPFGHGEGSDSRTVFFKSTARWFCSADACRDRTQTDFIRALNPAAKEAFTNTFTTEYFPAPPTKGRVPLREAQAHIRKALESHRPPDRTITIVRVTPGAGKSKAAKDFLTSYSAPRVEEDGDGSDEVEVVPGRRSIYATNRNALIEEGIRAGEFSELDHRVTRGPLSILRDTGPRAEGGGGEWACVQHDLAKAVQEAGGNLFASVCRRCPHYGPPLPHDAPPGTRRERTCEALVGTEWGNRDGALTVTNHAKAVAVIQEAWEAGAPYVVWDESPQLVQQVVLPVDTLAGLTERIQRAASDASKPYLGAADGSGLASRLAVSEATIQERATLVWLGEAMGGIIRALEVLVRSPPPVTKKESVDGYTSRGMTPQEVLDYAHLKGTAVEKALIPLTAAEVVAQADAVAPPNLTTAEALHYIHLGASIREWLDAGGAAYVEADNEQVTGSDVTGTVSGVALVSYTAQARLIREYGGVVLDATADVETYRVLAGTGGDGASRVREVAIEVEDGGDMERRLFLSRDLSVSAAEASPDSFRKALVAEVRRVNEYLVASGHAKGDKVGVYVRQSVCSDSRLARVIKDGLANFSVELCHWGTERGSNAMWESGVTALVTIGDHVTNLAATDRTFRFMSRSAEDEAKWWDPKAAAGQAHGRLRDPLPKPVKRIHLHVGTAVPVGWDQGNAGAVF